MYKVLVCDDERKIRETLYDYLTAKSFAVTTSENGREAVDKVSEESFDLILLDVMMPVMDGLAACSQIRKITTAPILFLSALGEEEDLLRGYKFGADDYITKPFPLSVLSEKILATIKRYKGIDSKNRISVGGITLDYGKMKVTSDEKEIYLTNKDLNLLSLLMENKGIVMSRERILNKIWGYDYDGDDRVVDTHIKRIRKSLGEKGEMIKTVIGTGYCFREGDVK